MRLISLASVLAGGLILGWAAGAQAAPASPPAEPIFYCPAAPAHVAAKHAVRHPAARHRGCPSQRVAHVDHERHDGHWRHHEDRFASRDDGDVSASQAFIYRYERALHGLNARAADAAWGHPDGWRPHGPNNMTNDNDPGWRERAAEDRDHHGDHMRPPDQRPDGAPMNPPDHRWDSAHMGPPDHRGEGDHMGPPDHRADAEAALRADDSRHNGYLDERGDHQGDQTWRSSERASAGEHVWTYRSESSSSWSRRDGHAGDGQWRDGSYGQVVEYAGRDAQGYLVWPGKTPPSEIRSDAEPDHDGDRDRDRDQDR
jgi:hypothetical protein